MSESHKGKKRSPEIGRKISEGRKLLFQNGYIHPFKGKHHTEKSNEKNRQAHLGKKQSEETIKKRVDQLIGKNNGMWKGDKVGYTALHDWVRSQNGKPQVCEYCGKTNEENKIEWCNKNHTYKRKLDDYIAMCTSCHRKYDLKNKLITLNKRNNKGQFLT